MHRKHALSLTWFAAYLAAAAGLSIAPGLGFWQSAALLAPPVALLIGLSWAAPSPDFSSDDSSPAEPIEDLSNPSRKVIWLNGPWEFRIEREKRWRRLDVPKPWNSVPGLKYYTGKARYRRIARVPSEWSFGSLFLRFRGANYFTQVYIDGKLVGTHTGGFTPFEFDVADFFADGGDHEIEIAVDNSLSRSTVPNVVGWSNDGGLLREVYLETRAPIHIDDIYIYSEPDLKGRADIAFIAKIHNPKLEPRNYSIQVYSPQGAVIHEHVVEGWTMQTLQHRFRAQFVSLWEPDNPALYRCRVSVAEPGGDELNFKFGVRSFEAGPDGLLLNGKSIRLRGASVLSDSPARGASLSADALKKDLEAVKSAGFNAVRFGPMPAHRKALELCDRMGLLVLQEIPVWRTLALDLSDPGYQQAAETQLREMVLRDRNRACLLAWGLAARIESDTSEARWFVERMAAIARGLDARPVYISTSDPSRETCADIVDFLAVEPDVKSPERVEAAVDAAAALNIPRVVFLPGAAAFRSAGSRQAGAPGTEENQAVAILDLVERLDANERDSGWVVSTLNDHRDPGIFYGSDPFMRRTGLMTIERREKLAFGALATYIKENVRPEIPVARLRTPITTISKSFALLWIAFSALFLALNPSVISKLAYDPKGFVSAYPSPTLAVFYATLFTALSWAVLFNRFFRSAPRVLLGSIDMPFLILISRVFRNEFTLFLITYASLIWFWFFNTTLLSFFMPGAEFYSLLALTAAVSLPDITFALAAFFRVSLPVSFLLFNAWKIFVCLMALGVSGTILFVLAGPAAVIGVLAILIERKFHIFKYLREIAR
ncbi:MAG TPA: glycoside hydrolase family 2 TIM barrel-domain containing protein [bacterium]|nr:glycoside hydrolase family 2 TIM barrel-domain containing protein [bacterium]